MSSRRTSMSTMARLTAAANPGADAAAAPARGFVDPAIASFLFPEPQPICNVRGCPPAQRCRRLRVSFFCAMRFGLTVRWWPRALLSGASSWTCCWPAAWPKFYCRDRDQWPTDKAWSIAGSGGLNAVPSRRSQECQRWGIRRVGTQTRDRFSFFLFCALRGKPRSPSSSEEGIGFYFIFYFIFAQYGGERGRRGCDTENRGGSENKSPGSQIQAGDVYTVGGRAHRRPGAPTGLRVKGHLPANREA